MSIKFRPNPLALVWLRGWGLYQRGTIMLGGKLFAKHHLVTVASFKKVTSVTSSGPHLVRSISQRDPPIWETILPS